MSISNMTLAQLVGAGVDMIVSFVSSIAPNHGGPVVDTPSTSQHHDTDEKKAVSENGHTPVQLPASITSLVQSVAGTQPSTAGDTAKSDVPKMHEMKNSGLPPETKEKISTVVQPIVQQPVKKEEVSVTPAALSEGTKAQPVLDPSLTKQPAYVASLLQSACVEPQKKPTNSLSRDSNAVLPNAVSTVSKSPKADKVQSVSSVHRESVRPISSSVEKISHKPATSLVVGAVVKSVKKQHGQPVKNSLQHGNQVSNKRKHNHKHH
jgi:hypothetical protein